MDPRYSVLATVMGSLVVQSCLPPSTTPFLDPEMKVVEVSLDYSSQSTEYEVSGETYADIREDLRVFAGRIVLCGSADGLYAGCTNTKWAFSAADCASSKPTAVLTASANTMIPVLSAASAAHASQFSAFRDEVEAHELHHVEIHRQAAQALAEDLQQLAEVTDCTSFNRLASVRVEAVIEHTREEQREFDAHTSHSTVPSHSPVP